MLANGQWERSRGQCNREQTAGAQATGKGEKARQELTAAMATPPARQTPSGARPNMEAMRFAARGQQVRPMLPGRSLRPPEQSAGLDE